MKNLLTVLFAFLALSAFSQQVSRQKVIVEVGTGTWCGACPYVVEIIEDLLAEGAQIGIVEYHINDDYENAGSLIRKSYYDFPWYPTTYYDSEHIGYDDWATYSVHKEYYDNRWATPSSFSLAISGDIDGLNVSGNILTTKVSDYINEELTLHVVLTESNIEEYWQGLSELDYVERSMFPDGNGTTINFSGSAALSIPFTFTMDPDWNLENCRLVFFLQDNTTQEILQGEQIDLQDLPLQSGISNASSIPEVTVFPNPFTESIKISGEGVEEIVITDVTGKVVYSSDATQQDINTSEWAPGMYLVTTLNKNLRSTLKIVKK